MCQFAHELNLTKNLLSSNITHRNAISDLNFDNSYVYDCNFLQRHNLRMDRHSDHRKQHSELLKRAFLNDFTFCYIVLPCPPPDYNSPLLDFKILYKR